MRCIQRVIVQSSYRYQNAIVSAHIHSLSFFSPCRRKGETLRRLNLLALVKILQMSQEHKIMLIAREIKQPCQRRALGPINGARNDVILCACPSFSKI